MRRPWLLALMLLLLGVVGGGYWFSRRPPTAPAPDGSATKRPQRATGWFDFGPRLEEPEPPPVTTASDAGASRSLHFRGRTGSAGRGLPATVHLDDDLLQSGADGAFERHQPYDQALRVWAETSTARSTVVTLTADVEGEVWLELQPVTRVTGRVLDAATGTPLASVTVKAEARPGVRSGPDGRFTLPPVAPGELKLELVMHGYRTLERTVSVPSGGVELLLRLMPLERFAGVVLDPFGQPVPAAELEAEPVHGAEVKAQAGADGTFEFWAQPPVLLLAWKGSLLGSTQMISTARTDLRVHLQMACRLELDVTVDGRPPAKAHASVSAQTELRSRNGTERGVTDDKGHVSLGPVSCGEATLEVSVEGRFGDHEQPVTLKAPTTSLTVALAPGRRLEGRVVDGQTRAPVAEAAVAARTEGAALSRTDADGHFELSGLPDGELELDVTSTGYARFSRKVTGEKWVDVALEGAREVRGRAVNPAGAPLRRITLDSEPYFTEAGAFRLRWPATRGELNVGCSACVGVTVTVPEGSADLGDVVLSPAGAVDVTVLLPDGRPASGALLYVHASPEGFVSRGPDGFADVGGHARLEGVAAEAWLRAAAPGYASSDAVSAGVAPGEVKQVTLRLVEGAWVSGVVRAGGRLLAGAAVTEQQEDRVATSGPDGRYLLGPLSAGSHELFWLPPGVSDTPQGQRAVVVVRAGERVTKDLGSMAGSRIEVWVRASVGRDMAMLMAGRPSSLLDRGEGTFLRLTRDGEYLRGVFVDVPPGLWTLFVPCVRKREFVREITVTASRDEKIVVDELPAGEPEKPR